MSFFTVVSFLVCLHVLPVDSRIVAGFTSVFLHADFVQVDQPGVTCYFTWLIGSIITELAFVFLGLQMDPMEMVVAVCSVCGLEVTFLTGI